MCALHINMVKWNVNIRKAYKVLTDFPACIKMKMMLLTYQTGKMTRSSFSLSNNSDSFN